MWIIGADYHPGFQQIAVDTETGELQERPAFIEVFLEDNKLYYRPVDSQETEGVLLYEN